MPTARTEWGWRPRTSRCRRGRGVWRNGWKDAGCSAALRSKRLAALAALARTRARQRIAIDGTFPRLLLLAFLALLDRGEGELVAVDLAILNLGTAALLGGAADCAGQR